LRGLHIGNASRIAVLLGEFIQVLGDDWNVRAEPSIELGMKLERGCPARRGREGAQEIRATWV